MGKVRVDKTYTKTKTYESPKVVDGKLSYTVYDSDGNEVGKTLVEPGTDMSNVKNKFFSKSDNGILKMSDTPSSYVSLDEDTGKITVTAPKMAINNETFKESINDTLKSLSKAYKTDKNYKFNVVDASGNNQEKSVNDIINELNAPSQNEDGTYNPNSLEYMASAAVGMERTKESHKQVNGVDLDDNDAIRMSTVAIGPEVKDTTLQLISNLPEAQFLRNIETYDPETGYAQYSDIMNNAWNKEKTSSEDMEMLFSALEDYFKKGNFSDKEEYIRNVATMRFLTSQQPEMSWIRDVTENVRSLFDAFGSFATNLGTSVLVASDYAGLLLQGLGPEAWDDYLEIYGEDYGEAYIRRGGAESSTGTPFEKIDGKIGRVEFDDNGVPSYKEESIAGAFEKPRTQAQYLRTVYKENQAIIKKDLEYLHSSQAGWDTVGYIIAQIATTIAAGNALSNAFVSAGSSTITNIATSLVGEAKDISDFAKIMYSSGTALSTWDTVEGVELLVNGLKTIYDIGTVTGQAANFVNAISSVLSSSTTLTPILGLIGESLAEAIVFDPDRFVDFLKSSEITDDTKTYMIETYVGNALGWGVGIGTGKFLLKAGETTRGRAISANMRKQLFKAQNAVGDAFDTAILKIRRVKGDTLANQIETLRNKGGRAAKQANALASAQLLRQARKAISEEKSIKILGQSTDEIDEALSKVDEKIIELQKMENALTSMQRRGMDIAFAWLKDDGTELKIATKNFYKTAGEVSDLERSAGKAFSKVSGAVTDVTTGKSLRLFSQTTTNYIKATEKLDYIDAYLKYYEKATDVPPDIVSKIKGYEKEKQDLQGMINYFIEQASPQLKEAADTFIDADRKWWRSFEDLRGDIGLTDSNELKWFRESGFWGDNGELYAQTGRKSDLSEYVIKHRNGEANVKTFDNYEQYMAGATGDFADPMAQMQVVLYDTASKQATRSFAKSYNALTGSLISKVSGEDTAMFTRMKKGLQKAYEDSSKQFLSRITNGIQKDDIIEDVIKNLNTKVDTTVSKFSTKKSMKTATEKMQKKLVDVDDSTAGRYISRLDPESTNNLWDEFYDVTPRQLIADGEQFVPKETKRYIYKKAKELGVNYVDTPESISLQTAESLKTPAKYIKSKGENFVNVDGYRLFAEEKLVPNSGAGSFEELMVLDQIRPGGNVDWYNDMIRRGNFGDEKGTEMLSVIEQNFGDGALDTGVANAMGVSDWDDFHEVMSSTEINEEILSDLVNNGNYHLNSPTILYKGVGSEGNRVNRSVGTDWLKAGASEDKSYQFVTLDEKATSKYFGKGDKYILRYHLPDGQGLFYFDRIGRGARDGGAFVLPPLKGAEVVRTGEKAKNGAEYVDILVNGGGVEGKDLLGTYDAVNKALTGAATPDVPFSDTIKRSIMSRNKDITTNKTVQKVLTESNQIRYTTKYETFLKDLNEKYEEFSRQYDIAVEELQVAGGQQTEAYINMMTEEGSLSRSAIDEMCRYYGLEGDQNAIRYFALSAYVDNEAKYKKELFTQLRDAVKKEHPRMPGDEQDRIAGILVKGVTATMDEEYNDMYLIVKELNPDAVHDADSKMMDEVDRIRKEIEEAESNRYKGIKNIVAIRNDAGKVEYYQTDPLLAGLMNFQSSAQQISGFGQAIYNANYLWTKLFRLGTTAINIKSMISQSFRDPINMFIGGGAYKTTQRVADNLVDVFGNDIVDYLKMYEPDALKNLQKTSEETGENVARLAVRRELNIGKALSPAATETNMYRSLRNARMARINGVEDIYDVTTMDKMTKALDNVAEKGGKLNEIREKTLRNMAYANGLEIAMKRGYSLDQARAYATFIMNESTTNFARMTNHLLALRDTVPYLGSAINGSKSFWKLLSIDPVGVVGRLIGGIIIPQVAMTVYSLQDEENRKIYKNIPEYAKEDNLILVVEGHVFSIPIPQEMSALVNPFRQVVEGMYGASSNIFGELLSHDILGFSPIELDGFTNLDYSKIETSNPGFIDRIGKGVMKMWAQLAPAPFKSGVELITGIDPYTGRKIDKSRTDIDENGNFIVKDYKSGLLAKSLNNMFRSWGIKSSAPVIQNVLGNIFGTASVDVADFVVSLCEAIPNGGLQWSMDTNALEMNEAYNPFYTLTQRMTAPIEVEIYDEAQSAWNSAVSQLYDMKKQILESDEWADYLKKKSQATDQKNLLAINSAKKNLVEDYFNKVKSTVENLQKNYGEQFTPAKYASVLSLMTMDEQTLDAGSYGDYLNTELYKTARAQAIQTMQEYGFPSAIGQDILGKYVTGSDGNIKVETYHPLAILQLDDAKGAALRSQSNKQHFSVIRTLVNEAGLYDERSNYQKLIKESNKNKDYNKSANLAKEYNEKLIRAVGTYIEQYTPESVLQGDALDYLKEYVIVPSDFQVNKYGKHISALGNGAYLSDAYKEPYLKYIFNYGDNR